MSDSYARYSQRSGVTEFIAPGAEPWRIGRGWAGHGEGRNNPRMQDKKFLGPLPRGRYAISPPITHPELGPFAMKLTPLEGTDMCGRDGFWIHGPAKDAAKYGQESNGCLILTHGPRVNLWNTGARILEVTE